MPKGERLSEKQQRFVEAYTCNGGIAYRAAEAAGYASPHSDGSRLLENNKIVRAIAKATEEVRQHAIATREDRQRWWTSVMLGEVSEKRYTSEGEEYEAAATLKDRIKASELLGRSQGDFLDRIKQEGDMPPAAEVEATLLKALELLARSKGGE